MPVGLALIVVSEAALSPGFFEVVTAFAGRLGLDLDLDGVGVTASLAVTTGCLALALPATWWVVRDLPLRSRPT